MSRATTLIVFPPLSLHMHTHTHAHSLTHSLTHALDKYCAHCDHTRVSFSHLTHGFTMFCACGAHQMVADGKLRPEDLVERRCSLAEGAEAIMAMDHGSPCGVTMVTDFS